MNNSTAFKWSVFGFICGLIGLLLGMASHTPFAIILGIIGMIGNGINLFRFRYD